MGKGELTRARMLEAAAALLEERGYYGTGLNDVLSRAGAPRGSLYFHFPEGKDQLVAEALAVAGEAMAKEWAGALLGARSTLEGLRALLEALSQRLVESSYTKGCPIAAAAIDSAESELVREACEAVYRHWTQLLATRLRADGIERRRAESLATVVLAAVEGALLLARARRDPAPLRAVSRQLEHLLAD